MRIRSSSTARKGFTLIELLLVIGIIAILASVVIIAINPSRQLASARNARRQSDVKTILDAFTQYAIDHAGFFQDHNSPPVADCSIPLAPAPPRKLCLPSVSATSCDFGAPGDGQGCVYSADLAPNYLVNLPQDPQDTTGSVEDLQTDFTVLLTDGGKRMLVSAPTTEMPPAASVINIMR